MIDCKKKMMVVLFAGILGGTVVQAQTPVALFYDSTVGPISFAAGDLTAALQQNGYSVTNLPLGDPAGAPQSTRIILTTTGSVTPGMPATTGLTNQGYAIQRVVDGSATNWWVIGQDAPGAMYGALELAEAVNINHSLANVTNRQTNPYLANRGIKFNIPLDNRTPTYSEGGSPARMTSEQSNVAEMWSLEFWTRFLDEMARHRYNVLSLWSLSPFPSLVRVPEYPNTALANVQGRVYNPTNSTWSTVTLKTMTMDDKIAFWRQVMQYGKDRGVDFYVFTWNIFVSGTENSGYGLTTASANVTTKDWVRRATRTLYETYPLLAGVGITAGENMDVSGSAAEQWLFDSYGQGVADAMADAQNPASPYYNPNRVIRLIHRAHMTVLTDITAKFQNLPGYTNADCPLTFSFKYSQAHMYSSTKPVVINQGNWFNSIPAGKKTWLTVRNDDMFYMRWGDPDFARSYLTNLPDVSKIAGFYMGPDGYCWGREFLSKQPTSPRQEVIDKMWYSFLLWGRLSYDPTLPNSRFQAILGVYFPEMAGANLTNLFSGWASVSKILPMTTRFYWGDMDYKWYPEACLSDSGFNTVQDFITPKYDPMTSSEDGQSPRLMSVKNYVDGAATNGLQTPLQTADLIQQYADAGLQSVSGLTAGTNQELRFTLGDINAMGWLGRYYAEKIRGATDLYRYQKSGLASDNNNAHVHLLTASNHWSQYAAQWSTQYVSQVLIRLGSGLVDIAAIQANVNVDIPALIGPAYTLTTSATNGSITLSPTGGVYSAGTVVTVTATANIGYAFSSWSGDLSGSANPTNLTMNTNKSVTANFVPVPTYTLTTSASNGSITLNPPGGVYNTGTVVTVTATPNSGYAFSSWSGDLSGSVNPATITMNTNKSISANFVPVPTYTLTTSATNGSITLNPPGGVYNTGTVVTVTATPNSGYVFGSWSGDLSGSVNPATITMNTNKNVTANFLPGNKNVLFVVADASNLGPSDTAIRNRLQSYGYTVQVVNDELANTTNATGKGLVLTSATVSSGNVTTKFRDVTVPVINWEYGLEDDYGFTTAANLGTASSQTTLNITNSGHPLAAGLPAGVRTVATVAGDFSWGEPGGSPTIIARLTNGSNHPCLYAYETNAAMTTGTAPARRVHLFLQNETFASLNADGLKLFDAALKWAMNVTSLANPTVTITQPTNGAVFTAGTNLLITASAGDLDGSVVKVEYFRAGTTKIGESTNAPAFSFTWTNATAGHHDLTATATDNDGATGVSAAVSLTIRTWIQPPTQEGGQVHLQWVGGGTLQTATNVLGPWSDVSGAVSPFSAETTNSTQFFRVRQ